ncbi:MAG: hypothetical protein AB1599_03455 [Planctomycetota bacterium]
MALEENTGLQAPDTTLSNNVTSGSSEQLKIGPPFTASVDVKNKQNNQASITFNLKDNAGNSYTIYNSEPSFQVISHSGETLWQGKFQFG